MKKIIQFILACLLIISCHSQECARLPQTFTSYSQALNLVKNSTFSFTDEANTSGSSWIASANIYSCDGKAGYLIYTTNRGVEYIHQGVPLSIWLGFKNATSKGSFYNAYIKNRYLLRINY